MTATPSAEAAELLATVVAAIDLWVDVRRRRDYLHPPPALLALRDALASVPESPRVPEVAPGTAGADDADVLTYAQVQHRLAIGRSTLYRLLAAGDLRAVSLAGTRRILSVDLTDYVERLHDDPTS